MTSAKAYYYPIASRPNLIVRLHSEVDKLTTSKSKDGKITVKAVQYTSNGSVKQAVARQEFILSGGIYGSPAILERSGFGDPAILNKLKIPVVKKLVGVGANLGDHIQILNTYQLAPGLVSFDNITSNATFAAEQLKLYDLHRQGILTYASSLLDFEPLHAILTKDEIEEGSKLLEKSWPHLPVRSFEAAKRQIFEGTPIEYQFWDKRPRWATGPSNVSYISIFAALQYPLSRGSSHISSRDPSKSPVIDSGYFTHPFDIWLLIKGAKHIRAIMSQPSMKAAVSSELSPGPNVNSEEEWKEYAHRTVMTFHHQTGTTAMLPLEDGGVVDPDLRVYGTENLRVIDCGVVPTPLAMHNQMTVYAIGELGAEKLLQSRKSL